MGLPAALVVALSIALAAIATLVLTDSWVVLVAAVMVGVGMTAYVVRRVLATLEERVPVRARPGPTRWCRPGAAR